MSTRLSFAAVLRLWFGARGPHVINGPASRTFDAQVKGRPLGEHFVAVSTPNFVAFLHLLSVPCLRPCIRPDRCLRARGLTVSHKQADTLRTGPVPFVGPWSGILLPGRWGSSYLPRLCLKFIFSYYSHRSLGKALARRLLLRGVARKAYADKLKAAYGHLHDP